MPRIQRLRKGPRLRQPSVWQLAQEWERRFLFFAAFGRSSDYRSPDIIGALPGFNDNFVKVGITPTFGTAPTPSGPVNYMSTASGTGNYVIGGGTAQISIPANVPFCLLAYARTSATQTQPVGMRNSSSGNPIADLAIGANGAATASGQFIPIARDTSGSITYSSSGSTVNDGKFHFMVIQRVAGRWRGSVDGALPTDFGTTPTNAQGAVAFQQNYIGFGGDPSNSAISGQCDIAYGALIIDGFLSNAEIAYAAAYPFSFFRSPRRRLYFGVSGGGRSVALTGQSATTGEGSLSLASSAALSGQSATSSEGTLVPASDVSLSGQSGTVSEGALGLAADVTLSGQASTVGQGTLGTSGGTVNVALTGQYVTVYQGVISGPAPIPPAYSIPGGKGESADNEELMRFFAQQAAEARALERDEQDVQDALRVMISFIEERRL